MEYTARCHCGASAFHFAVRQSRPANAATALCAFAAGPCCRALTFQLQTSHPLTIPATLASIYLWNDDVLNNYFCRHCGIFTYIGDGENNKDGYRVNLGCVEGIDPLALDISIIDGSKLPLNEAHGLAEPFRK